MRSPQSPKTLRYWQARLRSLRDPRVGGVAIALGLAATFGWIAWQNPESLEFSQSTSSEEPPTPSSATAEDAEDLAIGADIDSLSVLFNQVKQPSSSPLDPLNPTAKPKSPNPTSSDPETTSTLSLLAAISPTPKNPSQAELNMSQLALLGNLPGDPLSPSRNGLTGNTGLESAMFPGQTARSPLGSASEGTPPQNVLADALARFTNSPTSTQPAGSSNKPFSAFPGSSLANPPLEGTRPWPQATFTPNLPMQGTTGITPAALSGAAPTQYPPNAYTQVLQQAPAVGLDPRSPAFGTPGIPTGGTANPSITPGVGIPQSTIPQPGTSSVGMNQTVLPGTSAATNNQPQLGGIPQVDSFTTPRTTPGRYIGGGRINTFSNP
ncbi:hypothetical protein ACN4EG_10300 [Alkalinema pantanalense CENA528]|uniref:hypothetical protein n=1 Tax=Alkalinema pantanalense TaxID=1620705 RepID=UPI003D6F2DDA